MEKIKLIVSDIDGTVLDSKNNVDFQLREIISTLREQSIPFVLASARSPFGILSVAEKLGLENVPMACYNGALLGNFKDGVFYNISEHLINTEELNALLKLLSKKFPEISVNLYYGTEWVVEKLDKWVLIESEIVNSIPEIDTFIEKKAHKLLLIGNSKEIKKLFGVLQNENFKDTDFYLSKENYLEVTANNVSKEHALKELAKHYKLSLAETMTIGDNFNDIPMLESAGIGVAMGNAPKEVKSHATKITSSNDKSGVSLAIKTYVLK